MLHEVSIKNMANFYKKTFWLKRNAIKYKKLLESMRYKDVTIKSRFNNEQNSVHKEM